MTDLFIRFVIGGLVVSGFAVLGDVLRPKTFAGLFGAAPSVALATITLTLHHSGKSYAALEAHSMLAGAAAFFVYACAASFLLMRFRTHALLTTIALMPLWFGVAFGLWYLCLRTHT